MNSWITITGSSNGIGAALAEVFARNGYSVILHGRNTPDLSGMEEKIASYGRESVVVNGDIREASTLAALVECSREKKITFLINNVGYRCPGKAVEDLTDSQIDEMFALNCTIPMKLTREIYRHFLQEGKGGSIMNINSIRGLEPKAYRSIYAASRFAMRGFSESLRQEAGKNNVRVLNVYPARVKTKPEFEYGWNVDKAAEKIYQLFAENSSDDLILDSSEKLLFQPKFYPLPGAKYFFNR